MSKKNPSGLTDQMEKFGRLLTEDPERIEYKAYRGAYPGCKSDNTAAVSAHHLLKNPKMLAFITKLDAESLARHDITRDSVNKVRAAIINFDPAVLQVKDGEALDLSKIPLEARLALDVELDGDGNIVKLKNAKKQSLLDQASRQLGQYEIDNDQKTKGLADIFKRVDGKTRGLPPPREEDE